MTAMLIIFICAFVLFSAVLLYACCRVSGEVSKWELHDWRDETQDREKYLN